jgi:PTS system nitrogen regulatory IIA component
MRILDVLQPEAILNNLKSQDKIGVLQELVEPVAHITGISHEDLMVVLLEREKLGTTGIGEGVGIPHGKLKDLESPVLSFGLSRKGADFESIDGRPTYIFFLLFTPENSKSLHIDLLAQISRILKLEPFKERLLSAADGDEIYNIIKAEDKEF